MAFNEYFKEIIKQNKKFVIILGSGFHSNEPEKNDNCLNSWTELIKIENSDYSGKKHFLIEFEKIIVNETRNQNEKNASKIEKALLLKIADEIKAEQSKIFSQSSIKYPLEIFNNKYISDVISLNFDLVPEILLNNGKCPTVKDLSSIKSGNKKNLPSTRHRHIKGITFWHPHGDVGKYDSMILSVRKYCNHIGEIEQLRKRSKQNPKSENYQESWYDKLVNNPVLVLGASISESEWDLWSAITNRQRNFAKDKNCGYCNPMFKMRKEEEETKNSLDSYFYSLFDESMDFKDQWKELCNLFSK